MIDAKKATLGMQRAQKIKDAAQRQAAIDDLERRVGGSALSMPGVKLLVNIREMDRDQALGWIDLQRQALDWTDDDAAEA